MGICHVALRTLRKRLVWVLWSRILEWLLHFILKQFSRAECHKPSVVSELNYKLAAYFKLIVFDLGPSSQYILCNLYPSCFLFENISFQFSIQSKWSPRVFILSVCSTGLLLNATGRQISWWVVKVTYVCLMFTYVLKAKYDSGDFRGQISCMYKVQDCA